MNKLIQGVKKSWTSFPVEAPQTIKNQVKWSSLMMALLLGASGFMATYSVFVYMEHVISAVSVMGHPRFYGFGEYLYSILINKSPPWIYRPLDIVLLTVHLPVACFIAFHLALRMEISVSVETKFYLRYVYVGMIVLFVMVALGDQVGRVFLLCLMAVFACLLILHRINQGAKGAANAVAWLSLPILLLQVAYIANVHPHYSPIMKSIVEIDNEIAESKKEGRADRVIMIGVSACNTMKLKTVPSSNLYWMGLKSIDCSYGKTPESYLEEKAIYAATGRIIDLVTYLREKSVRIELQSLSAADKLRYFMGRHESVIARANETKKLFKSDETQSRQYDGLVGVQLMASERIEEFYQLVKMHGDNQTLDMNADQLMTEYKEKYSERVGYHYAEFILNPEPVSDESMGHVQL